MKNRFNIYGRFIIEIVKQDGRWTAFHMGEGTRRKVTDLVILNHIKETELMEYLDDFYHEYATINSRITVL